MDSLISVIVPVYNVKNYFSACIESIIKQTYKNLEIILVDDGSTDGSSELCNGAKKIDPRICVYHKINGGLSDARNYGLKKATGDYVVFVDSDDVMSTELIEYLIGLVGEKRAIGICDPVHCYPEKNIEYVQEKNRKVFLSQDAVCEMLYQKSFLVSAWGKIYPRDVFDEIEFPVGMLFEDSAVMYRIFEKVEYIVYGDAKLYGYMHREGSITTQQFNCKDLDILKICKEITEYMITKPLAMQKAATSYEVVGALRVFLNAPRTGEYDKTIRETEQLIKRNGFSVLKDRNARRKTRIGILMFITSKPLLFLAHKRINRWK